MISDYLLKLRGIKNGTISADPKKSPKPIPKQSEKMKAKIKEEKKVGSAPHVTKLALDKWYADIANEHLLNGSAICQECGAVIPASFMRHATAHLLPKKLFKSVAVHPLNYLILGAGCGCHEKTHRIDTFIKMSIWPEAKIRINEMRPLLPFDELKFLSSQLLDALDNINGRDVVIGEEVK